MSASILLTLVISLDFSLNLFISNEENERYFKHDSEGGSISLYRENQTIFLDYCTLSNTASYQISCITPVIQFEWPYYINGEQMHLINGSSETLDLFFNNHTFRHPVFNNQSMAYTNEPQPRFNYDYIIVACLSLLVVIQSPELIKSIGQRVHPQKTFAHATPV